MENVDENEMTRRLQIAERVWKELMTIEAGRKSSGSSSASDLQTRAKYQSKSAIQVQDDSSPLPIVYAKRRCKVLRQPLGARRMRINLYEGKWGMVVITERKEKEIGSEREQYSIF